MMKAILIAAATILQAYLLGSVDTGILVSKFVYHDDVRNHGSGAAGMTNMLRTFGKKAAAMTATGDVLKGVLAVCIGRWLFHMLPADAGVSPYLGVYLPLSLQCWAICTAVLRVQRRQGRAGGSWCHSGHPAGAAAVSGHYLSGVPDPHRHGVAGQRGHGSTLPGADHHLRFPAGYAAGDMLVCAIGSGFMSGMVIYMHRANIQRIREGKEYRFGKHNKK